MIALDRVVSGLLGVTQSAVLALLLLIAWGVIGAAVSVSLNRLRVPPLPWPVFTGVGLIFVACLLPLMYVLGLPVVGVSWAVMGLSVLMLAVALVVTGNFRELKLPRREFVYSFGGSFLTGVIVLSPILIYGTTYWTLDANDYSAYSSYASVWALDLFGSGHEHFLARHPDSFGEARVEWALFDKPGATGVLVFASSILTQDAIFIQSPFFLALLVLTVGLIQTLISKATQLSGLPAFLISAATAASLYPMVFLLSGQIGQVVVGVAVLLITAVAANGVVERATRSPFAIWVAGVVMGLSLAAALGANFLMTLAVLPVVTITSFWLLVQRLRAAVKSAIVLIIGGATALILTLPFAGWHREETEQLATGEVGLNYDLPSPLAFIGLQFRFDSISPGWQTTALWVLPLVVGVIALVRTTRLRRLAGLSTLVVLAASFGTLAILVGASNYATTKWIALVQLFLAPLVIAEAILRVKVRQVGVVVLLATITGMAILYAVSLSREVPYVVSQELFSLQDSSQLRAYPLLGVDLGNYFEDSAALMLLDATSVVALRPVFGDSGSTVTTDAILIRSGNPDYRYGYKVVELNAAYSLAVPSVSGRSGNIK